MRKDGFSGSVSARTLALLIAGDLSLCYEFDMARRKKLPTDPNVAAFQHRQSLPEILAPKQVLKTEASLSAPYVYR